MPFVIKNGCAKDNNLTYPVIFDLYDEDGSLVIGAILMLFYS